MGEELKLLVLALALAFLAESMTEYVFGQAVDHFDVLEKFRWSLIYVALAAGIGLAFAYQVDLLALIGGKMESQLGYAMSGLVIGRGANFVHDFISRYIRPDFEVFFPGPDEQRVG
jgi:ABC-type multidrug transport system fused ATPase/permease subunit